MGLFARIGYLLPYEAAFIVGPLSALTTVVFFFLPARSPRDAANPEHTDQINWWIAIYFAIIATALAISLLLRHESGGPHSGMANAVNLVHASTFVSIVAGGKMLILWHRRATLGPSGLVLGIMLLFLLPSALTIALV